MKLTDADQDAATAYHEAGHAYVLYWHFIRKGWCEGVGLSMDPPMAKMRGLRVPDGIVSWRDYAAHSAAGQVAECLWAERAGVWTWQESLERMRSGLDEEAEAFEQWGLEELDGDLEGWVRMGQDHGQPIDFGIYWQGYEEAEQQLRFAWPTVEALAEALLKKRHLTEAETLAILETER